MHVKSWKIKKKNVNSESRIEILENGIDVKEKICNLPFVDWE